MQAEFGQMHQRLPQAHWLWLDIEQHDELLGDLDLTTFPTFLICSRDGVLLFAPGPTTAEALTHFVRPYLRGAVSPLPSPLPLMKLLNHARSQALHP